MFCVSSLFTPVIKLISRMLSCLWSAGHLVRMGSYLDKPIVDKNSHSSEAHGLEFGVASMQGWRVEMEDAHTIIETIGKQKNGAT